MRAKQKQSNAMISRLSNPSEASAMSYNVGRVKTAKSHVSRSMINYDKIYIHSVPEI